MKVAHEKCLFCNHMTDFEVENNVVLLRDAKCVNCGASLRSNDVLKSILYNLGVQELSNKVILNTSFNGAVHNFLSSFDWNSHKGHYYYSEYFDDVENGQVSVDGVICVDLQNIPFRDNTFDLIISEDVLEHIPDVNKAFLEIARVLKPGGIHVFTIPINESCNTKARAKEYNPVYHLDSTRAEGAFVYFEFGKDICRISKTPYTITHLELCHVFYRPSETTDLDRDYNGYLRLKENPLKFFKYNSIVCRQIKTQEKHNTLVRSSRRFKNIFRDKMLGYFNNIQL